MHDMSIDAAIAAEERAMAEAIKMTEAEEALWIATFEACPKWGEWGQTICPSGPQSCSRDPNPDEIKMLCGEFKNNKNCAANSLANVYLSQPCAGAGLIS